MNDMNDIYYIKILYSSVFNSFSPSLLSEVKLFALHVLKQYEYK